MFEEERPSREISIRDFLRVVFRYKWVLVILFVVSSTVVGAINLKSPVLYESEARVLVRRGQLENMVDARYRYLTWQEEVLSELETVKSESVLSRAQEILKEKLKEQGLDREPLIARGFVQADVVKESNVLAIGYLHRDPVYVRLVTNAVTEAYMEYRETTYDTEKMEEFFAEQIELVENEMADLREAIGNLVSEEGLTFSSGEKSNLESRLSDLRDQLDSVRRDILAKEAVLEAEQRALEDGFTTRIPRDPRSSYGDINIIIQHKLKLADLRAERDAMKAQYTQKYPPLAALNNQIAALEEELHSEVSAKVQLDEMDLGLLKTKERSLVQSMGETQIMLRTVADKEGQYQQMQLDLETLQDRYRELKETKVKTQLTQATSPAWRVTLITPASRPFARKTKDYVRMALGPIFSIVVGLGLIFFVESLDHSIKSAAQAEQDIGLPVLATLWEIKRKGS